MRRPFLIACFFVGITTAYAQNDNYGADKANKKFVPASNSLGGRTDFNYLALADHPSRSGVPLGGIGAGNVQFAPNGRFVRIGLNNIHLPISTSKASFFALWTKTKQQTSVRRLVLDSTGQYGMSGVPHTTYAGLFPQASLSVNDDPTHSDPTHSATTRFATNRPATPQSAAPKSAALNSATPNRTTTSAATSLAVTSIIHAWSSLVPQDVKNSSLPMAWFDVELTAKEDAEIALAFSWEDFIGKGLRDPLSIKGMDGQIFSRGELVNGEEWPQRPAINTFSETFAGPQFAGIRQFSATPIIPKKATFQNYVNEVALLARTDDGAISTLKSFDVNKGEGWQDFVQHGEFAANAASALSANPASANPASSNSASALSTSTQNGGSAISIKTTIKKGQTKTLHFMLVWFYPELTIDKNTAEPGSYWAGGSDYGRYFHNYFDNIRALISYGIEQHDSLLYKTNEWQLPILSSSYPDWYKYKLINSAYVIYTNMILNKKGDVTINEGGMGGLAGTMDQRLSSHPFYQKFFTQLDRSEMEIFGDAQALDGSINHFIGHYYVGMGTVGGRVPTEGQWMLDNTEGWIIQIAKDYQQSGDHRYLQKYSERIRDGMKFLKSKMPAGVEIPVGPTTYDDFTHPPIYSYEAGVYLATLKAAEVVAKAIDDSTWAQECRAQFIRSQKDMMRMLWNGRFFAYGCEIDGSGRKDSILFTGQLAGEFVSRYCGWGDILPLSLIQSAIKAQFDISLSGTPDYYANKVWDMRLGHGIDQRGSQCWPFYLESYTAYPAIEAGYLADGLDILRHIQLVHLRKGLTWSQNLWNPGDITYMTGPVTWFSTDVFTGAGLNIPQGELRLAPTMEGVYPLYFPRFWATLTVTKDRITLKVIKVFGASPIIIKTLIAEPIGRSTEDGRRIELSSPFTVTEGAVFDGSPWYGDLMRSVKKMPALTGK